MFSQRAQALWFTEISLRSHATSQKFNPMRSSHSSAQTRLPQSTDLLQTYRGLVADGQIEYDVDQVRVIMHVWKNLSLCNDRSANICAFRS